MASIIKKQKDIGAEKCLLMIMNALRVIKL